MSERCLWEWKSAGQGADFFFHTLEQGGVLDVREDLVDEIGYLGHLGFLHTTGGDGGGADSDSATERDFFGIERDSVLVDGDSSVVEGFLGLFTVEMFRAEIDEHQVVVCPSGDDAETVFSEATGEG